MNYKEKDIDKIYTDIVLNYLQKGYIVYTPCMAGHQGEVSKVVLTKDDEIICVYMEDRHNFNLKESIEIDTRNIIIGKEKSKHYNHGILWLNKLIVLKKMKFYKVNQFRNYNNYYTDDIEFLKQCQEKQDKRLERRYESRKHKPIELKHKQAFVIAYRHCKQTRGYKTVKAKDIISVIKVNNKCYRIKINNKDDLIIRY